MDSASDVESDVKAASEAPRSDPFCSLTPWRLVALAAVWLATLLAAWWLGHRDSFELSTSTSSAGAVPSLYPVYQAYIRRAKHIDLTHAFSPTTPVWQGFGPSGVKAGHAGQRIPGFIRVGQEYQYGVHGFQTTAYSFVTDQLGTQLDPPAHWNEFGATISDIPATYALRPLVVIDIHDRVAQNPGYHAVLSDVELWERKHGQMIPAGSVVMFRSDYSKRWEAFRRDGLPAAFPGVNLTVLKFLHNERHILFHGHEPLDTDMTPSLEGEAWLMHNNFVQAEGVSNLDQVPEFGCLLSIGFAKPLGGTGGYARYIAICPESSAAGGVSIAEVSGAPLPGQEHPLRRDSSGVLRPTPGATPTDYCAPGTPALGCADGRAVW